MYMGKYGFNRLNIIMKGGKESLTTAKGQTKVALVNISKQRVC